MKEQTYNEFDVTSFKSTLVYNKVTHEEDKIWDSKLVKLNNARFILPVPENMIPTKRGSVRITEKEALHNNTHAVRRKKWYILAKEEEKPIAKDQRKELFAEAKELGIEFPKNIKTENLINKIKEAKE